jgi:hypothetical protein
MLNQGNGTFSAITNHGTGNGPAAVAIADLNADGRLDLVVVNAAADSMSVLINQGNGAFAPKVDYPTGGVPTAVAVGDLNGDGRPDLVVTNGGNTSALGHTISVLLNTGGGTFAAKVDTQVGSYPRAVVVADLNGDGTPDVAVANGDDDTISVLLGQCR